METSPLKLAIQLVDELSEKLKARREIAGKNEYGVYLNPMNEEVNLVANIQIRLSYAHSETAEGITELIEKAQSKGAIGYAAVHPVSPSSIQLYERTSSSPSGSRNLGCVPNTELARKILNDRGILRTLSNSLV